MATLTIEHSVYLAKEQRYSLNNGEKITVEGFSVPVVFSRGNTSEPAKEVFCKYTLSNDGEEKEIKRIEEGYEINLQQKAENLPGSEILLDEEDGGKGKFIFSQLQKVSYKGNSFNIIHFVELKKIETLLESLT
ncbi:MAG: hypothetical protein WCG45_02770 [bacterium]